MKTTMEALSGALDRLGVVVAAVGPVLDRKGHRRNLATLARELALAQTAARVVQSHGADAPLMALLPELEKMVVAKMAAAKRPALRIIGGTDLGGDVAR